MSKRETHRISLTMKYNHNTYLIKDYLKKTQEKEFIYYVDFIFYWQELLKCFHNVFCSKYLSWT